MSPRNLVVWTCLLLLVHLPAQEPASLLAQARELYWAQEFARAIPLYMRYLSLQPDDAAARVEQAWCLLRSDRPGEAREALGLALAGGRAGIEAETAWIQLTLDQGRAAEAVPLAGTLAARFPDNPEFAALHGRTLEGAGCYGEAARAWEAAGSARPRAWREAGRLHAWAGDFPAAAAALARYRAAVPDDPEGALLLAEVESWRWRWAESDRLLAAAAAAHPGHEGIAAALARSRDSFAPRVEFRVQGRKDSEDFTRLRLAAEGGLVLDHRLRLLGRQEWARFDLDASWARALERWSTTVGAAWLGPDRLEIGGEYTHHETDGSGGADAYVLKGRRLLAGTVVGELSLGRDEVTEKYYSLLEGIHVDFLGLGLMDDGPEVPFGAGVSLARYSDGPQRTSLSGGLELPLAGPVRASLRTWAFAQDERSYLYFGPRWYAEQEVLLLLRPLPPEGPWRLELQAGGQYAGGERRYGFRAGGDPGWVARFELGFGRPGGCRFGLRLEADIVSTDSPYSGYSGEAWFLVLF